MFVFSVFTSNNATSFGEAQIASYHLISCYSLSQFVQLVICCYLVVTGHCSYCCESVIRVLSKRSWFGGIASIGVQMMGSGAGEEIWDRSWKLYAA